MTNHRNVHNEIYVRIKQSDHYSWGLFQFKLHFMEWVDIVIVQDKNNFSSQKITQLNAPSFINQKKGGGDKQKYIFSFRHQCYKKSSLLHKWINPNVHKTDETSDWGYLAKQDISPPFKVLRYMILAGNHQNILIPSMHLIINTFHSRELWHYFQKAMWKLQYELEYF